MRWWQGRLTSPGGEGKFAWGSKLWGAIGALLLGVLLAQWAWVLLGPRDIVVPAAIQPASPVVVGGLFGVPAVSAVSAQAAMLPNVRLVGVFAGTPGFVVVELADKRQQAVVVGGEIVPGTKLVEVAPAYAVFERAGVQQKVMLPGNAVAYGSAPVAVVATGMFERQIQAASAAVASGLRQSEPRAMSPQHGVK